MFKRKAWNQLLDWKNNYAPHYACLIEGARRTGKTTLAEEFARTEYETFIKIDFSDISKALLEIFDDISDRNLFFLRLQAETGIKLIERKSVIIFDEVQLFPKARQAIKFLVKDARYDYIETGSLISIKRNVTNILIPSEEHKINLYPLDYEEFLWATGKSPEILRNCSKAKGIMGNSLNNQLMRDFRIYMAVGGMPQAVETFIRTNDFESVDKIKREIIELYRNDLRKIDSSGKLSDIYSSVPSQLALKKKHFVISNATGKRRTQRDEERIFELIDAGIVLPCYRVSQPSITLPQNRTDDFKLYISDTGLFTTLIFNEPSETGKDIYRKLLSNKLKADLGYLYENAAAQEIVSAGKKLYFYTWQKNNSTHYFEVDFLLSAGNKIVPVEIKSSSISSHESINVFSEKHSDITGRRLLFSQKDVSNENQLECKPMYMLPFILEELFNS